LLSALLIMLALTLWGVREQPSTTIQEPSMSARFCDRFCSIQRLSRFLTGCCSRAIGHDGDLLGVYLFSQYFLKGYYSSRQSCEQSSYLICIIMVAGFDEHNRRLALRSIWAQADGVSERCLMATRVDHFYRGGLVPSMAFTYVVGALFGIGYGAYQAVDWALAIDVLPGGEDAAKDMGIWQCGDRAAADSRPAITGLTLMR